MCNIVRFLLVDPKENWLYNISMIKYLLDSGDPDEYRHVAELAKSKGQELWGSTTNPSLIAKKLAGQKAAFEEAFFKLQKSLIDEILTIVPGAVSAEVYASPTSTASEMIEQGKTIASWHERVVVKLPTTLEGFKARTELRKLGITINNTLVFSQQQSYAISLHEKLMLDTYGKPQSGWPSFISPFLGRLDDRGEDGLSFLQNATETMHKLFGTDTTWMLAASIRTPRHFKASMEYGCEMITSPAKIYDEWFALSEDEQNAVALDATQLTKIPLWEPSEELKSITTIDGFFEAIENGTLDITHPLTDSGIERFVADWQQILL